VSFIHIYAEPARLLRQFRTNEIQGPQSSVSRTNTIIENIYRNENEVIELYKTWFNYCLNRFPLAKEQLIFEMELDKGYRIQSHAEWLREKSPFGN